jgi:uncharacterized membrane protein YkgB
VGVPEPLERLDQRLTAWMARHGVTLTRISLGIIFFWFGLLKFFPGSSPAEMLATATIDRLSGGEIPRRVAPYGLAVWEVLIGLGLLTGKLLRVTLLLLFLQMAGTLLPLLLFRQDTWARFPVIPTLEGQYIIKNLVLISAAIVVGATVRGGRLKSTPR